MRCYTVRVYDSKYDNYFAVYKIILQTQTHNYLTLSHYRIQDELTSSQQTAAWNGVHPSLSCTLILTEGCSRRNVNTSV